jgi:hypothetical protein
MLCTFNYESKLCVPGLEVVCGVYVCSSEVMVPWKCNATSTNKFPYVSHPQVMHRNPYYQYQQCQIEQCSKTKLKTTPTTELFNQSKNRHVETQRTTGGRYKGDKHLIKYSTTLHTGLFMK